jgi:hypothetical protein
MAIPELSAATAVSSPTSRLVHFCSHDHEVCDGILLDDAELERLASWLYQRRCQSWSRSVEEQKEADRERTRWGYCHACETSGRIPVIRMSLYEHEPAGSIGVLQRRNDELAASVSLDPEQQDQRPD